MSRLKTWWARRVNRTDDPSWRLYRAVATPATTSARLTAFGLDDTPETRFELLAVHLAAVWARLEAGAPSVRALKQGMSEAFVADMDASLRDMGAGELGVGKRVKVLTQRLYGRLQAYAPAFIGEAEAADIDAALRRNLYKDIDDDDQDPLALAEARAAMADLWAAWQALSDDEILAGGAPKLQ